MEGVPALRSTNTEPGAVATGCHTRLSWFKESFGFASKVEPTGGFVLFRVLGVSWIVLLQPKERVHELHELQESIGKT